MVENLKRWVASVSVLEPPRMKLKQQSMVKLQAVGLLQIIFGFRVDAGSYLGLIMWILGID